MKVCIGDICTFAKGASIPRDRMHKSSDYRYLHYGDLYKGHDLYIDVTCPQKPIPHISSSEKIHDNQFCKHLDIVYILTSETVEDLGKALLLLNPKNLPVVAGTETTILRVKSSSFVSPQYLNYILQTSRFKKLLRQYVTGMKVFRVHPRDLSRIEIDIPDILMQKRIVQFLDTIYDTIRVNSRINDYLTA